MQVIIGVATLMIQNIFLQKKTDDELKNKVLQNLQRRSIYSDAIIVSVYGGLVLLEGKIRTYGDIRMHSLEYTWSCKGLESVISIRP
jgi:osmotically-inducible protein OsmY